MEVNLKTGGVIQPHGGEFSLYTYEALSTIPRPTEAGESILLGMASALNSSTCGAEGGGQSSKSA